MDDDFEGALHDVPMDEQDKNRDSEDEEGDDDRIDQQMGDVGDNDEVRLCGGAGLGMGVGGKP